LESISKLGKNLSGENILDSGGTYVLLIRQACVETNVRIEWDPVYKAFHLVRCCGSATNCQY